MKCDVIGVFGKPYKVKENPSMRTSLMFLCMVLFTISSIAFAQPSLKKSPTVERIVGQVSSERLKTTIEKLVGFGTRHSLSDTISAVNGIGAARRWIFSEFQRAAANAGGRMIVEFQDTLVPQSNRIPTPTRIVNVIATLKPQTPTNRYVIISGHYDSRASSANDAVSKSPGANDDGSGTAVVLELARIFSAYTFRINVVFIAFAGEEQGLYGAQALARRAQDNKWNIEAVLNNDMISNIQSGNGIVESTYVRVFSEAFSAADTGSEWQTRNSLGLENDGASRTLARYVKEIGEQYMPSFGVKFIYRRDRFLRGGDHSPFHDCGFAAIRLTEAKENYDRQHQDVRIENGKKYGDMPEYVNIGYLTNNARINAAALATIASSPAPPSHAQVDVSALSYDSILRWNTNTEKDLAGYFVRTRETSSPIWQEAVLTRDTAMTLQRSKDDYLFGIQAVDADGNVSLPSIPRSVR
jgi:Zn-dependent M28 family amino/carboxypeptidase